MPAKPQCANCGGDYVLGHKWRGANPGACKVPKQGTRTFYRDPSPAVPTTKKETA